MDSVKNEDGPAITSVLNPDASEFTPSIENADLELQGIIQGCVRTANRMPSVYVTAASDYNEVTSQIINTVSLMSNHILEFLDVVREKPKRDDPEGNFDLLKDCNDILLDRSQIAMDQEAGITKKNKTDEELMKQTPMSLTVCKREVVTTTNIPRPQLKFKEPVDNSENLWMPKIIKDSNKERLIVENISAEGKVLGYRNPYTEDIEKCPLPDNFLAAEETVQWPRSLAETPLIFIDRLEPLELMLSDINQVTEIAVDLEHNYLRSYLGMTCLIQISTKHKDYIIDALALREHLHKLNEPFTNSKILKIFHGASNDILWLQRDFSVFVVCMVDTYFASKALRLARNSYEYILKKYCDIQAMKHLRLSDWRMRPLSDQLIEYARTDTHYLLYIWHMMKKDILKTNGEHGLIMVFEESKAVCAKIYAKPTITDESHLALIPHDTYLYPRQMEALRRLFKWRDVKARALDENSQHLLTDHKLFYLANSLPREMQAILGLCQPMTPFLSENLSEIHQIIHTCRQLPLDAATVYHPETASQKNFISDGFSGRNIQRFEPVPCAPPQAINRRYVRSQQNRADKVSPYPKVFYSPMRRSQCYQEMARVLEKQEVGAPFVPAPVKPLVPPPELIPRTRKLAHSGEPQSCNGTINTSAPSTQRRQDVTNIRPGFKSFWF
ncbi:unnamed protein product [Leptosia nina]|uniref:HRDC domain-containing protein n=1 Tax=Leptosia nina TaxID=320188 RepID=A0AAV1K1I0_9NEOP